MARPQEWECSCCHFFTSFVDTEGHKRCATCVGNNCIIKNGNGVEPRNCNHDTREVREIDKFGRQQRQLRAAVESE